jgi:hypothetical protein
MPIISKPRTIRVDLDPDQGFPVAVSVESIRYVDEDGVNVADLAPHTESYDPSGKELKKILNAAQTAAIAALIPYQQDLQRVAQERDDTKADRDQIKADREAIKAEREALKAELGELKKPKASL